MSSWPARGGTRLGPAWAIAVALCLLAAPARGAPVRVEGQVVSVRGGRVYVKLDAPGGFAEGARARLDAGGQGADVRLVAAAQRYVSFDAPGVTLAPGDRVALSGDVAGAAPAPATSSSAGTGAGVRVGRQAPSQQDYQAQPPPPRELVPFRGAEPAAGKEGAGEGAPPAAEGQLQGQDGVARAPSGLPANEVRGDVELGVDGVYDDEARISRTTAYGRLSLEVRRLFGSDRARFLFYGSVRQPFDGEEDWTGHGEDRLVARLSALVFQLDALPEEEVQSFGDRIELAIGRDTVPAVVEAGVVDGARVGVRVGPVTPFVFGGVGASPDPRTSDYDSVIAGGGLRFAKAFAHSGALRLSLAGAHERFRDEGERDFIEARGDLRLGAFGAHGALVIDLFDPLEDDEDTRLTTGLLALHYQLTPAVRFEVGYQERRPQYQADTLALELEPLVLPFLQQSARRDVWAVISLDLPAGWDLALRAEYYQGRDTRDARGGALVLGFEPALAHRVELELALRHRLKGGGYDRHGSEPFVRLTYLYTGEAVTGSLSFVYRASIPEETGDSRFAVRGTLDGELGHGFGLRGYAELELRRAEGAGDGVVGLLGIAARYRF